MKKRGFTLAEVLITLGIIGVVAAMTIPTLIANTNSSKFASQFKKSLSTLNQAALMAKAQHDTDYGTLTNTCTVTGSAPSEKTSDSLTSGNNSYCGLFNNTLSGATFVGTLSSLKANNTNYSKKSGSHTLDFANAYGFQLADGSLVAFPKVAPGPAAAGSNATENPATDGCTIAPGTSVNEALENSTFRSKCVGFIDVNGPVLPNKEVSCDVGTTDWTPDTSDCTVPKDTAHLTDIYPIVFHDGTVEPATNAAKAVLTGATASGAASSGSGS